MKLVITLTLIFTLMISTFVFADSKEDTFDSDLVFAKKAAQGGIAEVQLGKLAEKKSSNSEIKSFGGKLVTDHNKINSELKGIVSKKGMEFPDQMADQHKEFYKILDEQEDDTEFDRAFIQHMVNDHKNDINSFAIEAKTGADKELRGFAKNALPVLNEHLQIAQEIEPKIKAKTNSNDTTIPDYPNK